jgi:hypothetical protein
MARAIAHPRPRTLLQNVLAGPISYSATIVMCRVALWAIWNDKSWARRWAAATSAVYFLTFFRQFIIPVRSMWDSNLASLIVAIICVLAFAWPDEQAHAVDSRQTMC